MKIKLIELKKSLLFKDISLTFFLRIAGIGLMYSSTMLITNLFGAELYGRYTLAITILSVFTLVFSFGLPQAVLKLTSDKNYFLKEPLNDYLRKSFYWVVIFSVLGSFGLFVLSGALAQLFGNEQLVEYFETIAYFGVLFVLFSFSLEYLKGQKKFILFSLFMYIIPHLLLVLGIFLFKNRIEDNGVFLLLIHLFVYSLLVVFLLTKLNLKKKSVKSPSRKILSLSFNLMVSSSLVFMINWTDVFMLGILASKVELGIYNVAYKVSSLSFIVISTLNIIVSPKISNLYSEGNLVELRNTIQKFAKISTILTIIPTIILCCFGSFVLSFFGNEFVEGYDTLIILVISFLLNSFFGSVGQLLNMTKYQKEFKNFVFISLIINIIINILLIPKFGILGAAIGSLSASLALNIVSVFFAYKKFNFLTIYEFWK